MKLCRICKLTLNYEEFVKSKAFKSGIDTICLKCSREKVKLWRQLGNRDYILERQRRLDRNTEHTRMLESAKRLRHYDKYLRSPLVLKTKFELNATKRKADAKRLLRNANWDTELTDFVTKEAHHLKALRKSITKFDWHVDHIIPLNGRLVSGLHIWSNLRVIPAIINLRKNNFYEPR